MLHFYTFSLSYAMLLELLLIEFSMRIDSVWQHFYTDGKEAHQLLVMTA